MHSAVDLVFRQRHFELASEQPFGADLGEWLVELLVARRLEGHQLGGNPARKQSLLHESRLTERQLGGSGADSYNPGIGLFFRRHLELLTRARRGSIPSLPPSLRCLPREAHPMSEVLSMLPGPGRPTLLRSHRHSLVPRIPT